MKWNNGFRVVLGCILILLSTCMIFSGCSTLKGEDGVSIIQPMGKETETEPSAVYYDFGDVLIPKELKLDRKASSVIISPGFSAGILVLSGRVELNSLITFFENNMVKDNWRPVCFFKGERTLLLFHKENRYCMIDIDDGGLTTHVEVWVAPTVSSSGSGLLK